MWFLNALAKTFAPVIKVVQTVAKAVQTWFQQTAQTVANTPQPSSSQPSESQSAPSGPSPEEQAAIAQQQAEEFRRMEYGRDISQTEESETTVDLSGYSVEYFGDYLPTTRAVLMEYAFAQNDWDESGARTTWTWDGEILQRTGAASITQGISPLTTEWLSQNVNADVIGTMDRREQANYIISVITDEAKRYGLDIGDTRGKTAQEAVDLFTEAFRTEQQEIINLEAVENRSTNQEGYSNQDLEQARLHWRQLEGTFNAAPEMTLDVYQWAIDNFADVDSSDAIAVQSAIRNYITQELQTYGLVQEGVDLDAMNLRELTDYYLRRQNEEIELRHAQFVAQETARFAEVDNESQSSLLYLSGASPNNPNQWLSWQPGGARTLRSLERANSLIDAFEGQYGDPPDVVLLFQVASIFLEPLDWVMTGIEIIGDAAQGDFGNALVNAGLLIAPFAAGWMDNALSAGSHFYSGGSDNLITSGIQQLDEPQPVVLEVFGGTRGQIPGTINIDIDPNIEEGIRASALELPFANDSIDEIIANNPFIYFEGGPTESIANQIQLLEEAARVLKPGGQLILSGTSTNPYMKHFEDTLRVELERLGLSIEIMDSLDPRFQGLTFHRTDGIPIAPDAMHTIIITKTG